MKTLIPFLFLALAAPALGSPITADSIVGPDGLSFKVGSDVYTMPNRGGVSEAVSTASNSITLSNKAFAKSSTVFKQYRAAWDASVDGGAASTYNLGVIIPAGSRILRSVMDIVTVPTSSAAAPTFRVDVVSSGDIYGPTVMSAISVAGVAGLSLGKQGLGANTTAELASNLAVTNASSVSVVVGAGGFCTGKIEFFFDVLME